MPTRGARGWLSMEKVYWAVWFFDGTDFYVDAKKVKSVSGLDLFNLKDRGRGSEGEY